MNAPLQQASEATSGGTPRRCAFLVFAGALALRALVNAPAFVDPSLSSAPDTVGYRKVAASILTHGHHLITLHRAPGYPYLLAAIEGISGSSWLLPLLINLAGDAATATLVFLIAVWLGRPLREAWVAAALYSVQPVALVWSGLIMTETLFTLMLLGALWGWFRLRDDDRLAPAFVCGLAFGGGILLRVLLSYLIPILLILEVARDRSRWRQACSCLAGVAVLTLPFVLLHGLKLGEWTVANTSRGSVIGYEAPAVLSLQDGRSLGEFMTEESFLVEGKKELRRRGGWDPPVTGPNAPPWWAESHDPTTHAEARKVLLRAPHLVAAIHAAGAVKSLVSADLASGTQRLYGGNLYGFAILIYLLHAPVIGAGLVGLWSLSRIGSSSPPLIEWNRLAALATVYLLLLPGPASESRFLMPVLPLLCLAAAALTSPKHLR